MRTLPIALGALVVACATPLLADKPPPPNALPLSQIVALVERTDSLHWIEEVEWDDDGYWEVEYVTTDGREVEVKIDPVTGATLR